MIIIKPIHERLLIQLAHYKFLTVSQFHAIGVGHQSKIREGLIYLRNEGLVKHAQYASVSKRNLLTERIHFLTAKGAKTLIEYGLDHDTIKYPKSNNSLFRSDFFHRISTINTHIAFEQYAQTHHCTQLQALRYFDKSGSQRNREQTGKLQGATRLVSNEGWYLEPDMIISFCNAQEQQHLYLIEVFNGNDTKRVVEQLSKIYDLILQGVASDTFQFRIPAKLLATFEHESNMIATIKRLKQLPQFTLDGVHDYFFFAVAQDIKESCITWKNLNNESMAIL